MIRVAPLLELLEKEAQETAPQLLVGGVGGCSESPCGGDDGMHVWAAWERVVFTGLKTSYRV